jgi:phosphate starvation-inducible PhoH-like protein
LKKKQRLALQEEERRLEEFISSQKENTNIVLYCQDGTPIKAKNQGQQLIINSVRENDMSFVLGPAGTGKTFIAVAMAVRALKKKQVKKIIISRPAITAGENIGFLPGDMKEKLDPYMRPIYDALGVMIAKDTITRYIKDNVIEIAPMGFMRGRTLDAFVILDEAQNATMEQMKMFLTRMGTESKYVITGDLNQIDLAKSSMSGLSRCVKLFGDIPGFGVTYLKGSDVIRHPIVEAIINRLKEQEEGTV